MGQDYIFSFQSMVPLNGGGSLSSSRDTSEAEATPMEVSENDEENEIESV